MQQKHMQPLQLKREVVEIVVIPDSLLAALNACTGTTCARTEVDTSLIATTYQATVYTKTN